MTPPWQQVSDELVMAFDAWMRRPAAKETANHKEDVLKAEAERLGVRQTVLHDVMTGRAREVRFG